MKLGEKPVIDAIVTRLEAASTINEEIYTIPIDDAPFPYYVIEGITSENNSAKATPAQIVHVRINAWSMPNYSIIEASKMIDNAIQAITQVDSKTPSLLSVTGFNTGNQLFIEATQAPNIDPGVHHWYADMEVWVQET